LKSYTADEWIDAVVLRRAPPNAKIILEKFIMVQLRYRCDDMKSHALRFNRLDRAGAISTEQAITHARKQENHLAWCQGVFDLVEDLKAYNMSNRFKQTTRDLYSQYELLLNDFEALEESI
jgi:hypothetical protein